MKMFKNLRIKNLKLKINSAGFIRLTKKALVMGLIFSILLPSIILYSLFIYKKSRWALKLHDFTEESALGPGF